MAFFKKEKPQVETETKKNTRDLEELSKMFSHTPEVQESVIEDSTIEKATQVIEQELSMPVPILNSVKGKYDYVDISKLQISKNCVKTDELIIRDNNGNLEIIGLAPVNAKIISATNEEISLMILDYLDKTVGLEENGKMNLYKFELQNPEIVKRLSGRSPAALNGYNEEEFAGIVLKSNMDIRFKDLPTNVAIEISKLSPEMQEIIAKIVASIGPTKLTAEAIKSLSDVPANENAVLMKLLQF